MERTKSKGLKKSLKPTTSHSETLSIYERKRKYVHSSPIEESASDSSFEHRESTIKWRYDSLNQYHKESLIYDDSNPSSLEEEEEVVEETEEEVVEETEEEIEKTEEEEEEKEEEKEEKDKEAPLIRRASKKGESSIELEKGEIWAISDGDDSDEEPIHLVRRLRTKGSLSIVQAEKVLEKDKNPELVEEESSRKKKREEIRKGKEIMIEEPTADPIFQKENVFEEPIFKEIPKGKRSKKMKVVAQKKGESSAPPKNFQSMEVEARYKIRYKKKKGSF